MKRWSYISAPDVDGENLVFLVDIQDLNERHSIRHFDSVRRVVNGSTNHALAFVLRQQVLD